MFIWIRRRHTFGVQVSFRWLEYLSCVFIWIRRRHTFGIQVSFRQLETRFLFETFFRRSFFLCLYVDPSSPHLPLSRHCAFVFRVSFRQLQRSPCGVHFRILPEPSSFFLFVDMDPSSPLWCLYRDPSCLIFGSVTPSDVAPRALTFPVHLL